MIFFSFVDCGEKYKQVNKQSGDENERKIQITMNATSQLNKITLSSTTQIYAFFLLDRLHFEFGTHFRSFGLS